MGPEGGEEGGMVIARGTPEEVAAEPASHTGRFLAELLTSAAKRRECEEAARQSRAQTQVAARQVAA